MPADSWFFFISTSTCEYTITQLFLLTLSSVFPVLVRPWTLQPHTGPGHINAGGSSLELPPPTCSYTAPTSPACHGYEQRSCLWEAEPGLWQTKQQSHRHHGCDDNQRQLRRLGYERGEEWRSSGEEESPAAASPEREETVTAGEGHLPVVRLWEGLRAHLPSCGSQAHSGV